MGCYHCQSVNGSDPRCEDSFFNNFGDSVYQSDCKAGKHVIKLVMEKMKISNKKVCIMFFFVCFLEWGAYWPISNNGALDLYLLT